MYMYSTSNYSRLKSCVVAEYSFYKGKQHTVYIVFTTVKLPSCQEYLSKKDNP